jgi:hypothetical protein
MTHRQLKKQVLDLLRSSAWPAAMNTLEGMPARQVVNPLFGLLYHGEPLVRWRAVSAMGAVVAGLADRQMESARIIMRRFMWNLNDESGGIGWGSPESMAEIMARHDGLAREYTSILISYADPEGNFLEHPGLQQGVLWALGRLGRARPEVARRAAAFLLPFLRQSHDPILRGLAVWAIEPSTDDALCSELELLRGDHRTLQIYIDPELVSCTVSDLADRALSTGQGVR